MTIPMQTVITSPQKPFYPEMLIMYSIIKCMPTRRIPKCIKMQSVVSSGIFKQYIAGKTSNNKATPDINSTRLFSTSCCFTLIREFSSIDMHMQEMPYPKEIQHHSVKKKKKNHTSDEEEKARGQYTAMHSFPPDWMMNVKGITLCFACWLLYTYINIYSKKKRKKKTQCVCLLSVCRLNQLTYSVKKKKSCFLGLTAQTVLAAQAGLCCQQ